MQDASHASFKPPARGAAARGTAGTARVTRGVARSVGHTLWVEVRELRPAGKDRVRQEESRSMQQLAHRVGRRAEEEHVDDHSPGGHLIARLRMTPRVPQKRREVRLEAAVAQEQMFGHGCVRVTMGVACVSTGRARCCQCAPPLWPLCLSVVSRLVIKSYA
eukprot:7373410-Prymnesium_polylepis.1